MAPGQSTETHLRDEEKGAVSMQNIVRRLSRRMKKIEALYQEIDKLHDLIPAPTPEEFEEMASGRLLLKSSSSGFLADALFI